MNAIRCLTATVAAVILLVPQVRAQEDAPKATYTLIQNVRIFDGVNNKLTPGNVLIENNLIKEVGAIETVPKGAIVIDGGGRTLMPGLIESHVHLNLVGAFGSLAEGQATDWDVIGATSLSYAKEFLDDGYTTVRMPVEPAVLA